MPDVVLGKIHDERGQPVASVLYFVEIKDFDASGLQAYSPKAHEAVSNPDGHFKISLDKGDYAVYVGEAKKWSLDVRVPGDGATYNVGDIKIPTRDTIVHTFEQTITATTWTWNHNKLRWMIPFVVDENDEQMIPTTLKQSSDKKTITATFPWGKRGKIHAV